MNLWFRTLTFLVFSLSFLHLGMSRQPGQYDEEAREAERIAKQNKKIETSSDSDESAAKRFAGGVKEASVDGPIGFIEDTVEGTQEDAPIVGTLEGARKGTGKILDSTVRGAVKVVTLGQSEAGDYDVIEPEKDSGEPTKIRIKIPGT